MGAQPPRGLRSGATLELKRRKGEKRLKRILDSVVGCSDLLGEIRPRPFFLMANHCESILPFGYSGLRVATFCKCIS